MDYRINKNTERMLLNLQSNLDYFNVCECIDTVYTIPEAEPSFTKYYFFIKYSH